MESLDLWWCLPVLSCARCSKESPRLVLTMQGWPKDATAKTRQSSTHGALPFGDQRSWRRDLVVTRPYLEASDLTEVRSERSHSWLCQPLWIARGLRGRVDILPRNFKSRASAVFRPTWSQWRVPNRSLFVSLCFAFCSAAFIARETFHVW